VAAEKAIFFFFLGAGSVAVKVCSGKVFMMGSGMTDQVETVEK